MRKRSTIVLVIVFAVFIGAAVFAYSALRGNVDPNTGLQAPTRSAQITQPGQSSEKPKTKAPDFTVLDAGGKEVRFSSMFGKPIVLNFWASWCPPCKSEMPEFNKVYKELGEKIQFIMVNLTDGQRETVAAGTKYISDQKFSFPVYFDTKQEAAYAYGIQSIPTTLFIDREGYIVTGAQGAILESMLRKGIGMAEE